jgi:hypothetical protein
MLGRSISVLAEPEAIVADYLQQASDWDAAPAQPVCLRDRIVEAKLR